MASHEMEPILPAGNLPEDKMNVGEELRDRDFPEPEAPTRMDSLPVAEYETMPPGDTRQGGRLKDGDRQRKGDVPTVFDQTASMPDLAQEEG